jgi:gas vesicle protein
LVIIVGYPSAKEVNRMCQDNYKTALASFILGGMLGAGVALLLAPQTGKKTRRMLRETAEDIKEMAEEMRDHAAAYTEKLKGKLT